MHPKYLKHIRLLKGTLVLVVIWWGISLLAHTQSIPNPLEVFINLFKLVIEQHLLRHIGASVLRLFVGIVLALVAGGALGLLIGSHAKWDEWLSPIIYILFPIPKVALLPILFIFLGLGESSRILLIFLIVVFQVIVAIRDAVKNIPQAFHLTAKSLKLSAFEKFRHVIIPSMLPPIFSSMRISVGIGIAVLFFAENYATHVGIGYFIMNSWSLINYLDMYSGIVAMSLMGAFLLRGVDLLDKKWGGKQHAK